LSGGLAVAATARVRMRYLAVLLCLGACDHTVDGQKPVGGDVDTDAEIQRYLRRAYLDLTGHTPSDTELADATTRLREQANTPTARGAFVDELIQASTFATVFIDELENNVFGGNDLEAQYAFVCGIIRGIVQACNTCTNNDSCACQCANLPAYLAERESLRTTEADIAAGQTSSSVERRYASAQGYYVLAGTPEGITSSLFDDFLGRPAEADEIENGRNMVIGALLPGSPAGLLFHRHGSSYPDMVDIVFTSEVYREAMVRRTFNRYLAREPSSVELAHFVATLDANDPDARPLVRAVVSSREYFDQ
jgi:hypothetical protein